MYYLLLTLWASTMETDNICTTVKQLESYQDNIEQVELLSTDKYDSAAINKKEDKQN